MNREHHNDLLERLNLARAHGALDDLLGSGLQRAYRAVPHDPLIREMLEYRIRKVEHALKTGQLSPFLKARLQVGELILGNDVHGAPIKVLLDWLCSGLLTVANTGGGKSNWIFWIVTQLACLQLAVSTWLFEPYKTQLRLLLPLYQRAGKSLIVLPWQDWRWNLLQCDGVSPNQQSATAVDLLVRILDLPGRAAAILRQGIHELYARFGVWAGETNHYPTLFHLYEWVRGRMELNAASRDAILDRLGAFLLSLTPACGAWTRAWSQADLASHNIVFELRGASEVIRNLLPQSLLFGVFHARIARGLVNSPLELLLIFDDGQRIFCDRTTSGGDLAPLDELAGIIRGAGIGLWPIVQSTVGFSRRLRPNMALKVFGRLGCHEDYATLAADCGLNSEQLEFIRLRLVPGMFVGQVGIGDWTHPFLFRVPQAKLPGQPTDGEIRDSQRPLAELRTCFAEEFTDWTPHPVGEITTETKEDSPQISEVELRLLRAVVAEPGRSVSHYCRITRLSGKRIAGVRRNLVNGGFIREHEVAVKARGRAAIIIEPLAPAFEAVRNHKES